MGTRKLLEPAAYGAPAIIIDWTGLDFEGLELSGDATEHEWFN